MSDAPQLAHRLRQHTQGEVLFSDADRGRYSTDASIYQQMPVGVLVPRTADDVANAIDIARDLGAKTVDLTSRPSREAANRLYQRIGFEPRETNVYRYSL